MNDCNFCRYMQNDDDVSQQNCSKWVNSDSIVPDPSPALVNRPVK